VHLDPAIAIAGLVIGFTVGLTGMGGGALATPILILIFKVPALAAVGSDLAASLVMKPFGGGLHIKRGTVRKDLVGWLVVGSVPSAVVGVLVVHSLHGDVEPLIKRALGVALVAAATTIVLRAQIQRRRKVGIDPPPVTVRPAVTVAIGVIGGLIVGMTSVGSGSLMIVLVLLAYPGLSPAQLVGTDLVQAIPLVAAATMAHGLFGDIHLGVTASLVIGGIPGVLFGARLSSRSESRLVRPALFLVLLTSGLKLLV
jgi:uncharacterized protein